MSFDFEVSQKKLQSIHPFSNTVRCISSRGGIKQKRRQHGIQEIGVPTPDGHRRNIKMILYSKPREYQTRVEQKDVYQRYLKKKQVSYLIWRGFLFFISVFIYLFYLFLFFPFICISWRLIPLQYCSGFCHTLTWISHGFTCVPHPNPPSHPPHHPIHLGLPSAPALSTCLMRPTWAGDLFHPW